MTLPRAEYDRLLQTAQQYDKLVDALFRGGLTTETLYALLNEDTQSVQDDSTTNAPSFDDTFVRSRPVPVTLRAPSPDGQQGTYDNGWASGTRTPSRPYYTASTYAHSESIADSPDRDDEQPAQNTVPVHDQRTIHISNISDRTTLKDIVGIIRGGMLVEIFQRNDRSVQVSFVEGAQDFMAYAKKNDLYLHYKRLEFRWSDRQFRLPNYVAHKISHGATRNILIRGAASKRLTTEQITEHLDHIHNLVVVDAKMVDGDAYISTNSIHNASFARTCLLSRTAYKGLRIEWYPDECATPLPQPLPRHHQTNQCPPAKSLQSANPYSLLGADLSDAGSDNTTDSGMPNGNGVRLTNWADGADSSIDSGIRLNHWADAAVA